ncbi:tRNA-splicing endonuclease subunit Sen15, partial [Lineolata rhizophorae]
AEHAHPPHLRQLARQVQHNLRHQHRWASLAVHTHSCHETRPGERLPLLRPLLSGLPQQRLYLHPDEQIELLEAEAEANTTGSGHHSAGQAHRPAQTKAEPAPEPEWVLPTHAHEKWTLRNFALIFDHIPPVPPEPDNEAGGGGEEQLLAPWRKTKRLVLATVDTDSTITYYIVHEGVVKPRQN